MNVTWEDFARLDIRIATVTSVERVAGAERLLRFTFDVGAGEQRQVVAAMAPFFDDPDALRGRQMPVLLNVDPRVIRGCESQGMIIAADRDGRSVLLQSEIQVPSGSKVR